MARPKLPVIISEADKAELTRRTKAPSSTVQAALRARVVLLAAEGLDNAAKQQVIMAKASSYAQTGKFDEAMKVCDEAVALAPDTEAAPMIQTFKSRLATMKEKAAEAPKEKEKEKE